MKNTLLTLLLASSFISTVFGQDWPIYRGPQHNGILPTAKFQTAWEDEPATLWKAEIGVGFASFTAVGGKLYTAGWAADQDTLFCLDAKTGKEVWKYSYAQKLGNKYYEGGTSATPSIYNGQVYHLSRAGEVFCLNAKTGAKVWVANAAPDLGLKVPEWGFAGSPIIMDGVLVINIGQSGAGLDPKTGKILWKSGDDRPAGYSTAYPMQANGKSLAVLATGDSYVAVEAKTGKVAWDFPWKTSYDINAADPILVGPNLFISSGYGTGSALLSMEGGKPKALWQNKTMHNQFNSSILHEGHLYGIDGNTGKGASLKCIEAATGKEKWQEKSIGFGSLILAGKHLIVLSEKGMLLVAPANPEKFAPSGQAQILGGKCWTTPTLVDGVLYARNAKGDTVAIDLREK